MIWRRNRLPTITIQGGIVVDDAAGHGRRAARTRRSQEFAARCRPATGWRRAARSRRARKSQAPIIAVAPLMLFVMATLLMIQLQSFSAPVPGVAVAPLGLIGVVAALLPSGAPLGFVAILGVLALIGILIRNSVILVVQIEDLRSEGRTPGTP